MVLINIPSICSILLSIRIIGLEMGSKGILECNVFLQLMVHTARTRNPLKIYPADSFSSTVMGVWVLVTCLNSMNCPIIL